MTPVAGSSQVGKSGTMLSGVALCVIQGVRLIAPLRRLSMTQLKSSGVALRLAINVISCE